MRMCVDAFLEEFVGYIGGCGQSLLSKVVFVILLLIQIEDRY